MSILFPCNLWDSCPSLVSSMLTSWINLWAASNSIDATARQPVCAVEANKMTWWRLGSNTAEKLLVKHVNWTHVGVCPCLRATSMGWPSVTYFRNTSCISPHRLQELNMNPNNDSAGNCPFQHENNNKVWITTLMKIYICFECVVFVNVLFMKITC
jgi:hypothetical protein